MFYINWNFVYLFFFFIKALGIQHLKDISLLINYCTPYAWCPNCIVSPSLTQPEFVRHHVHYENDDDDNNDDEDNQSNDMNLLQYSQIEDITSNNKNSSDISLQNIVDIDTYSLNSSMDNYIKNFQENCEYTKAVANLQSKQKVK